MDELVGLVSANPVPVTFAVVVAILFVTSVLFRLLPAWIHRPSSAPSTPRQRYDVFVSYRRDGGGLMARNLRLELEGREKRVFIDVEGLHVGRFDEQIPKVIEDSDALVLVLSPGCLDHCVHEDDWVRLEVMHALNMGKRIVPLVLPGFSYSEEILARLPEPMRKLPKFQSVAYDHVNHEAAILRILNALTEVPHTGLPGPASVPHAVASLETGGQQQISPEDLAFAHALLPRIAVQPMGPRRARPSTQAAKQIVAALADDEAMRATRAICHTLLDQTEAKKLKGTDRLTCLYLLVNLEKRTDDPALQLLLFDTYLAFIARALFVESPRPVESISQAEFQTVHVALLACERRPLPAETKVERVLTALPNAAPATVHYLQGMVEKIVPPAQRREVCERLSPLLSLGPQLCAPTASIFESWEYYEGKARLVDAFTTLRPGSNPWLLVLGVLTRWKAAELQELIVRELDKTDDEEAIKVCVDYLEIACTRKAVKDLERIVTEASPRKAVHIRRSLERQGCGEVPRRVELAEVQHIRHALGPRKLSYGWVMSVDALSCGEKERFGLIYEGASPESWIQVALRVTDIRQKSATVSLRLVPGEARWLDMELAPPHQAGTVDVRQLTDVVLTVNVPRPDESLVTTGIGGGIAPRMIRGDLPL